MISYHNKKAIKTKYVARMKEHMLADELVRGIGWNGERGCAVGCTLHNYKHNSYELELGIPSCLARIEDVLFEHMVNWKQFPLKFLEAIPVGVDLEPVVGKLILYIAGFYTNDMERFKQANVHTYPTDGSSVDYMLNILVWSRERKNMVHVIRTHGQYDAVAEKLLELLRCS